jgi:SAM-dependent methyltransferase
LEIDSGRLRNPARRASVFPAPFSVPVPDPQSSVARPSPWITWNDIWLPLGLGVLMMALLLGFQFAKSEALWLRATLTLGLPAAICYTFIQRPVRFALGIGALLLVGGLSSDVLHTKEIHQERSFFGVLTVLDKEEADPPRTFRLFYHGNTMHGLQNLDPQHHQDPLAYYFRTGPVGQLMDSLAQGPAKKRIAVLGLGAGALACYAKDGQAWTFFEIDPSVESIARSYFTFLEDAKKRGACIQVIPGDGRLSLSRLPDRSYDLIFADAFSSDAVPVHLLTRQALDLYLSKLNEHGLIAFNVTNRYVNLEPVLGALAAHAGLVCLSCREEENSLPKSELIQGKTGSHWVVMSRHEDDLGNLRNHSAWKPASVGTAEWTDDYSNLLGAFRW